jgi:branched-chain amino acid transport system permease protein
MSDELGVFLNLTASGLTMGMIYAMLGVGLILLLRAVGVLNFAQGDFLAIGAYVGWWLAVELKLKLGFVILFLIIIAAACGALFMYTCYWPLRKSKWPQAMLICTIGASTIITELLPILFGTATKTVAPNIEGQITIGSFSLQYQYILVFVFCLLALLFIYILFEKTYAGKVMSAAAQQKYAAELIGIPTAMTTLVTYILVLVIACFSGYLLSPIYMVTTRLKNFQSKAFIGIVLGGTGSIKGCIVGSLIMGLIEAYSTYVTTLYQNVIVFGVLLLVLMIKPNGIFASSKSVTEKV